MIHNPKGTRKPGSAPHRQARQRPALYSCLLRYAAWIAPVFTLVSCEAILPAAPDSEEVLAEPVADLSPQQLAMHLAGDEEFARVFGAGDGLGPIFVGTSCEGCHVGDGKGHPLMTLTRFGRYENGVWDPMRAAGGPQLQQRAISGFVPEQIPAHAEGITRLIPPAVTGLGYLEAVADADLLALADPDDRDGDGISGRPHYVAAPEYFVPSAHHREQGGYYIGRFGKKAGAITLQHQVVAAYINDMGITSDFHIEDLFNPYHGINTGDLVADPEVPAATVHAVTFYIRTLKVPPRRNPDSPVVRAGEQVFGAIGCGGCHTPTLRTGPSDIAALSEVEFHPYTDLLLHDMGPELNDGYVDGNEEAAEWRTPPLWGIGLAADSQGGMAFFMHDGRAHTLEQAILLHGGEAAAVREAYRNLSQNQKDQLIAFLESL